jgi:hypothetical protein
MAVGPRDRHRQRQSVGGDQQVVLGAQLGPVGWVGTGQLAPPFCPDADRFQAGPRTVQQALLAQFQKHGVVEFLPHPGRLPRP